MRTSRHHPGISIALVLKGLFNIIYFCAPLFISYYLIVNAFPGKEDAGTIYSGNYYSTRFPWLFSHIALLIAAMLLGPVQHIFTIKGRRVRIPGRNRFLFIAFLLLTALFILYLFFSSYIANMYSICLVSVSFLWVAATAMTFLSGKRKSPKRNREWRIRSFVITIFLVTIMLLVDYFQYPRNETIEESYCLAIWAAWTLPLFITKLIFRGRDLIKK